MTLLDDRPDVPDAPGEDAPSRTAAPSAAPAEGRGGIRGLVGRARSWRELRDTPYGLTPILVFAATTFFQRLDSSIFGQAAPEIAQSLDIGIGGIISIIALIGFLMVFVGLGAGWLLDRYPRVPFFGIGTIVSGVFSIASAGAMSMASLAVPRAIDDASEEGANIPRSSLLADYYPVETRGRVFAMLGVLSSMGALVTPFVIAYAVDEFGWRTTTVVMGIPMIPLGAIVLWKLREPVRGYMERKWVGASEEIALEEEEPLSFGESWRTILAIRTVRRLFLGSLWGQAGFTVFTILFPFYLVEEYGLDIVERAWVFAPATVMAVVGGYIGGGLVDAFLQRRPSQVLIVAGSFSLIATFGIVIVALTPPLWVITVFYAVNAFGSAMTGPARGALYTQVLPAKSRTLGLQFFGLTGIPGFLIFTPLAYTLLREYSFTTGLLVAVPPLIIGAVIDLSSAGLFEGDMRNAIQSTLAEHEVRERRDRGEMPLLLCRGVDVSYSGVQVLFDIDFEMDDREIVALLGTNGAGKSTLLRAISGSQQAEGGTILFEGRDITRMPPHETAARGIIQMPGGRGIFPGLTVKENLLLGNWMNAEDEVPERMAEVYEVFPALRDRADALAGSLSGGEQQQLSLAQAFVAKPKLLLIDELSLGLSPVMVANLIEIVREINRRGVAVIVVEQSVNVALTLAERAIFMEKGEVRFSGPTADLLRRPDILRAVYVKGAGALTDGAVASATGADLESRPTILEVAGMVKRYGGVTAVDGVSFGVRDGEVLGLIGPNGSGKTTLFDLISGFQAADEGQVTLEGLDISDLSPEERSARGLVRRFQDARMFSALTVHETLLIALDRRIDVRNTVLSGFAAPQARRSEQRVRVRADRLVELLELGAYRDKFVAELSTGLRRIVDLACVLAAEPRVLLLDEPSSGIAQAEAEALGPLLGRIRYETGCSLLLVEHDMPLISSVSDELLALDQGQVLTRGRPADVLDDPRVVEAYLGGDAAAINRSGSIQ